MEFDRLERTAEAGESLAELETILAVTLKVDDTIDWDSLKDRKDYDVPKPAKPLAPRAPLPPEIPREPHQSDLKYHPKLSLLDKVLRSRRDRKELESVERYRQDHTRWMEEKESEIALYDARVRAREQRLREVDEEHKAAIQEWELMRARYLDDRQVTNDAIDEKRRKYLEKDSEAILDYCDLVLSKSSYPDYFPQEYELDFVAETGILIVDYQVPPKDSIPTLKEVRYVQSKNEFTEKHISDSQLNKFYDSLLYQIALRTIHEVLEADRADVLAAVVFNGYVNSVDPATGKASNSCILSLQTSKAEFLAINLGRVEPKACFKSLRGVGSSKLHSLTPVAPIMWINREDKRFVGSYDVADTLAEGYNLATMDWEDFEHLVREMFEKEFSEAGGEVRVTQASRDGGIDAVVFDPDPIRGGKIVIQAKRYTNTVGVSAVRDLYGTVMNEGANKGVLVTTADYGPDAYSFANGKPLVLISGSNLLHLLEKHGHKARIDLKEARKLAAESARS